VKNVITLAVGGAHAFFITGKCRTRIVLVTGTDDVAAVYLYPLTVSYPGSRAVTVPMRYVCILWVWVIKVTAMERDFVCLWI